MRAEPAKHQRTRTRTLNAIVFGATSTIIATALALAFLSADAVVAAETPKAAPAAKPTEKKTAPAKPEPISLADYLTGLSKAVDQAAFAKKHAGATVTWTGYLRTINKNISPDGTFYQLILRSTIGEEKGTPDGLFLAVFSGADEKRLVALEKDQKVTVSGTLEVDQNPALPRLVDAKLSGS